MAEAVIGPTPGIRINRLASLSSIACCPINWVRPSIRALSPSSWWHIKPKMPSAISGITSWSLVPWLRANEDTDSIPVGTRADEKQRTWRIPAGQLEGAIAAAVQNRITQLSEAANVQQFPGTETLVPEAKAALNVVEQVSIAPGHLKVDLNAGDVQKLIGAELDCDPDGLSLDLPFTDRRRGVEMKLVVGNGAVAVDEKLLANITRANHWYQRLKKGHSFEAIAVEAGSSKRRVQQVIDLAFLAPDIVRDITNGAQPMGLTSDWCLRHDLPSDWQAQRQRIATL